MVDERALREIHLPAFEAAVTEGKARAVMSAYNLVNGQHCSENKHLLTDILKGDWAFKGIVMSDWVSVYSAAAAANNGLDLEMPHPIWFNEKLLEAVQSGQVSEQTIDEKSAACSACGSRAACLRILPRSPTRAWFAAPPIVSSRWRWLKRAWCS